MFISVCLFFLPSISVSVEQVIGVSLSVRGVELGRSEEGKQDAVHCVFPRSGCACLGTRALLGEGEHLPRA